MEQQEKTMAPLRVGIIGCGRISRLHVRGYDRIEQVSVVAAADPISEMREEFGREFGVENLYDDYRRMLTEQKPEIVSICTWPPLHAEMVLAAVSAGVKVIFCEKPIATGLGEADEMVAACEQAGVLLVVNHYRRFAEPYRKARRLIASGEIGTLERIHVRAMGDLLTDGTHSIDLVRFVNDDVPVTRVFGQIDTTSIVERYGHWTEAGSLVSLGFENGVEGLMELGSAVFSDDLAYQRLLITGSTGSIDVKGDSDRRLIVKRDGHEPEEFAADPAESGDHAFEAEVRAALDVLSDGGRHPLSGSSARTNLEVLIAVFESARQHRVIALPITTPDFPLADMVDAAAVSPEIEIQRRAAKLGV